MPRFRIDFAAIGRTHTIIEADDDDHAREVFSKGHWQAAEKNRDSYDIDSIEEVPSDQ